MSCRSIKITQLNPVLSGKVTQLNPVLSGIVNLICLVFNYLRYFKTRNDDIIIDSKDGLNADLLAPVSSFNGVDATVNTGVDISGGTAYVFEIWVNPTIISAGTILYTNFGTTVNGLQVRLDNSGTISILKGGVSTELTSNKIFTLNESGKVTVKFDVNSGLLELYIDSVLDNSITTAAIFTFVILGVGGKTTSSELFEGNIWDTGASKDGTDILFIPLPHLGYGFDQNDDPVTLTVNNVTEDYIVGGSKWLIEKGAVAVDAVNKVTNPSFVTDLSGWNAIGNHNTTPPTRITDDGVSGSTSMEVTSSGVGAFGTDEIDTIIPKAFDTGDLWGYSFWAKSISGEVNGQAQIDFFSNPSVVLTSEWKQFVFLSTATDTRATAIFRFKLNNTGVFRITDVVARRIDDIIPNKPDGSPISLTANDILIPSTSFINTSPFIVDFGLAEGVGTELVTNGDLSDGLTGWIQRSGLEYTTFENVNNELHLADVGAKVAGNITISLAANIKYIASFKVRLISGTFSFATRSNDALTSAPENALLVTSSGNYSEIISSSLIIEAVSFTSVVGGGEGYFDDISIKKAPFAVWFFDKSDTTIWKDEIRNSQWYDANNPLLWHSSELNTDYLEANLEDDYKRLFFPKIANEIYEFLSLYNRQLTQSEWDSL